MTKRIGLIGGSGLYTISGIPALEEVRLETPFGPPSDAFIVGKMSEVEVVFLSRHGRGHVIPPSALNYRANVWGFKRLGCDALISASACGSMKESYRPTDVVLPDQLIDLTRGRSSTFFDAGCVAHVSMAHPYCPSLLAVLEGCAREAGARVHSGGTYLCIDGPQFSTKAESYLYRSWGVDVIGMTNATEAKLCREAEICYASLALVTDYDCWHEEEAAVTVEVLLSVLKQNAAISSKILAQAAGRVDPARTCACRDGLGNALVTLPPDVPAGSREKLSFLAERYWG